MEVLRSTIISYYLKATYLVCISLSSWILSIPTCYIYRVKKRIITLGEKVAYKAKPMGQSILPPHYMIMLVRPIMIPYIKLII